MAQSKQNTLAFALSGLKYPPIPTMDSLIEPVNWFEELENG